MSDEPRGREPDIEELSEAEFEAYMRGDSELSRRYAGMRAEGPPEALDRAILAEARKARRLGVLDATPVRRWVVPVTLAATLLLSFSVVMHIVLDPAVRPPMTPVPAERRAVTEDGLLGIPARRAEPQKGRDETASSREADRLRDSAPRGIATQAESSQQLFAAPPPAAEHRPDAGEVAGEVADAEVLGALETAARARVAAPLDPEGKRSITDEQEPETAQLAREAGAAANLEAVSAEPGAVAADEAASSFRLVEPTGDDSVASVAKEEDRALGREAPAPYATRQDRPAEAALPESSRGIVPAESSQARSGLGQQARDPEAWLAEIRELYADGRLEEAKQALAAFREHYPEHPLDATLLALEEELDSDKESQ